MSIDTWNPKTFDGEILAMLVKHSKLIFDYHVEMDKYIHCSSCPSFSPNQLFQTYHNFHENTPTPIIVKCRIRTWHYTRLTDEEADAMAQQISPSSLHFLRHRLNNLVAKQLITDDAAKIIFDQSVFHKQPNRAGILCTTTHPIPYDDPGVNPLLENWGGESAYFWLHDEGLIQTLKNIGTPRIIEIETSLSDKVNGYSVAGKIIEAWACQHGAPTTISGCALAIGDCINTAKVLRIHTKGDNTFETIGTVYPEGITMLQDTGPHENGTEKVI